MYTTQVMFYCWDIEPTDRLSFANLLQHLDSLVSSEYEEADEWPSDETEWASYGNEDHIL